MHFGFKYLQTPKCLFIEIQKIFFIYILSVFSELTTTYHLMYIMHRDIPTIKVALCKVCEAILKFNLLQSI